MLLWTGERGGMAATHGLYWGVPVAVVTCWMLVWSEVGLDFSQKQRKQYMGPWKSSAV